MPGVPTRQEYIDFINRKVSNKFCELCGENSWAIPADTEMAVALPILQQGSFSIPPPSIPAMITVCTNCGNIRMHAMAIVKP
jgi:hypothetical protein